MCPEWSTWPLPAQARCPGSRLPGRGPGFLFRYRAFSVFITMHVVMVTVIITDSSVTVHFIAAVVAAVLNTQAKFERNVQKQF